MRKLDEEQVRIRGYIQSQAARLTVPAIMDRVRADGATLRAAAEAATSVPWDAHVADGEWSVNEVLHHLWAASGDVNRTMLAAALRGEQPGSLADMLTAVDLVRSPLEWFDLIAAEREEAFSTLLPLRGDEHLDIRWEHPFFGELNWREWLLFLRLHDLDHANQLKQVVAALTSE
jgi:hypothetical protein